MITNFKLVSLLLSFSAHFTKESSGQGFSRPEN